MSPEPTNRPFRPFPAVAESAAAVAQLTPAAVANITQQIRGDGAREESWAKSQIWNQRIRAALAEKQEAAKPDWDKITEFNWHFDHGRIAHAHEAIELSDSDIAFAKSAEGKFLAMAAQATGQVVTPEKVAKWRKSADELLRQSYAIADKMTLADWDAYRKTPFGLFRYFLHSRHVERIPSFRRCCFIPYVAQAERAPMVAALEYFIERNPLARMWTMTSGPRVRLILVRSTLAAMHRKTSELNDAPFMKDAGVEIVFRGSELGSPEYDSTGKRTGGDIERDEDGQLWFHVHEHLVVIQKKGFIPPQPWSALLKKVGEFWGAWWCDGDGEGGSGRIAEPREVCKYVTKPGEMEKLSGAELVALQRQLSRMKLIQPMGAFAAELKARKDPACPLRLIREQTPDGRVFREVKDWNAHGRQTREEKAQRWAAKKMSQPAQGDFLKIVARQMPGFGPCGIAEPRVVVMCSRWDEAAVRRDPSVKRLIEHTAAKFRRGEAISVHVCTPTVGETRAMDFVRTLAPPRHNPTGAELAGLCR